MRLTNGESIESIGLSYARDDNTLQGIYIKTSGSPTEKTYGTVKNATDQREEIFNQFLPNNAFFGFESGRNSSTGEWVMTNLIRYDQTQFKQAALDYIKAEKAYNFNVAEVVRAE